MNKLEIELTVEQLTDLVINEIKRTYPTATNVTFHLAQYKYDPEVSGVSVELELDEATPHLNGN